MDDEIDRMDIDVPAGPEGVEQALSLAEECFRGCGVREPSTLLLVLGELLRNASQHGCRGRGRIRGWIRRVAEGFEVEVRDEGQGFDVAVAAGVGLPDDPRNRSGYALINALARRVEFANNGNTVRVLMVVGNESTEGR